MSLTVRFFVSLVFDCDVAATRAVRTGTVYSILELMVVEECNLSTVQFEVNDTTERWHLLV